MPKGSSFFLTKFKKTIAKMKQIYQNLNKSGGKWNEVVEVRGEKFVYRRIRTFN